MSPSKPPRPHAPRLWVKILDLAEDYKFGDLFRVLRATLQYRRFDGRSDYGPFIDAGIPAGGLFAGAEGYDNCYHKACDNLGNVSEQALDEMSDAAADAVLTFAMTESAVNGTAKASTHSLKTAEFKGPHAQR